MLQRTWWKLVRLGFRLLYNEMAWTYDLVSWLASLGEWRNWQRAGLSFVRGQRVLEIAHGPGHMLLVLARAGHTVTGLDLSAAMGRIAGRRLHKAGLNVPLVRGRVQAPPFADRSFDTVYCTFPTIFIAEPATLAAVYRILVEGGRFIIVPEGHLTGSGLLHRFINWLYIITGQRKGPFTRREQQRPEEPLSWPPFRTTMESSGFQVDVHRLELSQSSVTVIVATRAGD